MWWLICLAALAGPSKSAQPAVSGRYEVSRVAVDGELVDFKEEARREALALDESCVLERQMFDFGAASAEGAKLPGRLEVSEVRACKAGGLGMFTDEVVAILAVRWTQDEGSLSLHLPSCEVSTGLTRLEQNEGVMAPAQWLTPTQQLVRPAEDWVVEIKPSRRRDERPTLMLTRGEEVMELVPFVEKVKPVKR